METKFDVVTDLKKIVSEITSMFNEIPYKKYVFLVHLTERGYGGLEHENSNFSIAPRHALKVKKDYENFLALEAHEFFHVFNVKRSKPEVFMKYDYERENYTRLLWIFEGFTSYYTHLTLVRAGLISEERYFEKLAETIKQFKSLPGRFYQTVEEASFDAWIKLYRPNDNTPNSTISYYLKGNLLALIMDLEIRSRTKNEKSLDDVLRYFYYEFYKKMKGIPENSALSLIKQATGVDLKDIFEDHVKGLEDIDFNRYLSRVGLDLQVESTNVEKQVDISSLGVKFDETRFERLVVTTSLRGFAGRSAGLLPGDEILAINNERVLKQNISKILAQYIAGDKILLTISRDGYLKNIDLVLDKSTALNYKIIKKEKISAEQEALLKKWLKK